MPALAFDAVGSGGSNSVTAGTVTATGTHTATAGATVFVDVAYNASPTSMITGLTRTATYGGVAMTSLGAKGFAGAGQSPYTETFALANVPGGTQTVSVSSGAGSSIPRRIIFMSTSYVGVVSLGTAQITNATSGTAASHVVTSAARQIVHQAFGAVAAITAYNQTSRFNGTLSGASTIQVGDAVAAGSTVTFSATLDASTAWASIAIPITGANIPLGAGSGAYGWVGHAVGKRGTPKGHGSGAYTWVASARGKRSPKAHGVGGFMWQSTVRGNKKAHGVAAGLWGWHASGFGLRLSKGHGSGAYKWIGSGRSGAGGRSDGAYGWVAAAVGRFAPRGTGSGRYEWVYQHLAGIALHRLAIVPHVDRSAVVAAVDRSAVVAQTSRAAIVPAAARRATVPQSDNRTTIVP